MITSKFFILLLIVEFLFQISLEQSIQNTRTEINKIENNNNNKNSNSHYQQRQQQQQKLFLLNKRDEETLKVFKPTKDNVKLLGRAKYLEDKQCLWFGLTNTGIEYEFLGKKSVITITADEGSSSKKNPAHFIIYADQQVYLDDIINRKETTLSIDFDEYTNHTVRFMKVSECLEGTLRINDIKVDSNLIVPTPKSKLKFEFIGDSITCGYGNNSTTRGFSTLNEYGTRTYAYLTAEKFKADYSIVCYSGFGMLSGYSSNGVKNDVRTVPPYYEKLGYTNFYYFENESQLIQEESWDSKEFIPDLIVINLGTNDRSYLSSIYDDAKIVEERANFIQHYIEFLQHLRAIHPNAEILGTYGIMEVQVSTLIEKAIQQYQETTGDEKVHYFKFSPQDRNKNGIGSDGHPTYASHLDASKELIQEIQKLYAWANNTDVINGKEEKEESSGSIPRISVTLSLCHRWHSRTPPKHSFPLIYDLFFFFFFFFL
ncbi:SGNH hydrolase-type esterase domain-containing protein [Neocallimastix sp. 'constans']